MVGDPYKPLFATGTEQWASQVIHISHTHLALIVQLYDIISIRACKTCAPHNCSWTSWMIFCKFAVVHWPGYTILKTFLSPKTVVVLATTGPKASLANKNSRNQKSWLNNLSPHQLNTVGHLVCTETYCCRLQPGREGSRGRSRAFLFVFVRFLEGSLPTQQRFVVSTGLTPPKLTYHPPKNWWLEDDVSFEHVC